MCGATCSTPTTTRHDNYYLARGGMQGTWEGLDPDVIVATWFYDKRDEKPAVGSRRAGTRP